MREYPNINEEMFRSLDFDSLYATPATDEELQAYMHANYVDIDDDDFSEDDDFGENLADDEDELPKVNVTVGDLTKDDEDLDFDSDSEASKTEKRVSEDFSDKTEDDDDETVESAIQSIIGKPKSTNKQVQAPVVSNKVTMDIPKNTETLREHTSDVIDLDELPF